MIFRKVYSNSWKFGLDFVFLVIPDGWNMPLFQVCIFVIPGLPYID